MKNRKKLLRETGRGTKNEKRRWKVKTRDAVCT